MPHSDSTHRILVIDDNPSIIEDFRKILCFDDSSGEAIDRTASLLFDSCSTETIETDSYTVDFTTQGREGLDKIRQAAAEGNPYALVFVDIRTPPGWDGVETVANIWREFSEAQVVIYTAYSDHSWEQAVARLGQSDRLFILNKPFDTAEVRQLVVAITMRARAEAEAREARETVERLNRTQAEALINSTKALEELCDAAEEANRAKSQFLANMSHELRTPLHGVLSFAAFGMKKIETASREDLFGYFLKIDRSGKVLLMLVNDLLDLAKLEAGRMTFEFAQVNLRSLIAQVADEFSSTLTHRRITVIRPRPDFDTLLIADSARLMQVVRNLFSNAVKFSPDESTIEITIERKPASFLISVIDQGIGIPEDELETVFDKFVQSSKTRSSAGGTGLGLAICEEIITAHRGRIWARNQPQGGAVLRFEIPLNPNDVESVRQDNQSSPGVVLEQPGQGSLSQGLPT